MRNLGLWVYHHFVQVVCPYNEARSGWIQVVRFGVVCVQTV